MDTKDSSILCFDVTRTTTDLSTALGTYTVLFEGRDDAHMESGGTEAGGTDTSSLGHIALVAAPSAVSGCTVQFDSGAAMNVQPFAAAFGSDFDFEGLVPTPSFEGMFFASSGTLGTSDRIELVFSVLSGTIVFRWYHHGTPLQEGNSWSATYSYAFGAGVIDA